MARATLGSGSATDGIAAARFLVVDDDDANVHLLTRVLRIAGASDIQGVTDPAAVVPTCLEQHPDVLILDLHLGRISGHDVLDQLNAAAERPPAVIVLSGETSDAVRARALAAGARDFVTKPFDINDLVDRVAAVVASSGATAP